MALQSVIASKGYGWNVKLVNLQEILDPLDVFRKITGIRLQDIYNKMLAKGWTLGSPYLLPAMQSVMRRYHPAAVKLLTAFWKETRPDMVVSLVPNLNRALFESLESALPEVPFITVLTDLADYPPHFWIEKQPQYFICGTERAVAQAKSIGHSNSQVFQVSGMILRPHFYEPLICERKEERKRLGLRPDVPTGLVLFGGEGSDVMFSIAERLGNSSMDLQLILICGRNEKLFRRLRGLKTRNRLFIEGFTKDIPYFMHLSDFFIGKPGPGSISEAVKMRLPVIAECNAWTLPQERYNADWVRERGIGVILKNFRGIEKVVRDLISSEQLGEMKRRLAAMENQAVFEVAALFEKIFESHYRAPIVRDAKLRTTC